MMKNSVYLPWKQQQQKDTTLAVGPVILDPKVQWTFETCDCRTEAGKPIPPPAAAAVDDIMEHLKRCLLKHSMGENAVY